MPNESHSKFVQGIVNAFEDFALFCGKKWRAALIAIALIILLGATFLTFYYIYVKINKISEYVADVHTTPETLQEGLVLSIQESQQIDLELTRIVSGENASGGVFIKFHDSKTDLQGKHDFYYSGVNEVLAPGNINSYLPFLVDIPVTRLGDFILPMVDHKCQKVFVNQITNNNWLRRKLSEEKIDMLFACPIHDKSNRYLLGFIELIYGPDKKVPADLEHTTSDLVTTANNITNIISK